MRSVLGTCLFLFLPWTLNAEFRVRTDDQSGTVLIEDNGQLIARYSYRDAQVKRPYFSNVKAPNGIQVTRNWPPVDGIDRMDHATIHPGIWMAFGDINGGDFWRNKALIRHNRFIKAPSVDHDRVTFVVENEYIHDGVSYCVERAEHEIYRRAEGYLFVFDSRFRAVGRLSFGDQQEMGLGVRLASALMVEGGTGRIENSEGQVNESQAWGQHADWTDYSGVIDRHRSGILLMPDPRNLRRSRFHSRDYGFTAANPFSDKDFVGGEALRTRVSDGMRLHMQFGLLVYSRESEQSLDKQAAYNDFLEVIKMPAEPDGIPWKRHTIDASSRGADGVRLADINEDGFPDLTTGWEQGGEIHVCIHPGVEAVKSLWPKVVVGNVKGPEDAVFLDLDGDGWLDVVSSTEGDEQTVFAHFGPGNVDRLLDESAWVTQAFPVTRKATRWMFALPMDIDGGGGTDLVLGSKNPHGVVGWLESPAHPKRTQDWKWHRWVDAGWIMSLRSRDMDGDGDQDVLYSDRSGRDAGIWWLENPGSKMAATLKWEKHFVAGRDREVMFLDTGDLDGDGLEDILAAARDDAFIFARRSTTGFPEWEESRIPYPPGTGTGKAVAIGDMNNDGANDFVVTCERAEHASGVFWLEQQGQDWLVHDISGDKAGIKYDRIELIDLDLDGDLDVVTCDERDNLGVIWYENPLNSK